MRSGSRFARVIRTWIDQGLTSETPAPLAKRIRLTNGLALFGAVVMFASVPFDWHAAPTWMVVEDLAGGTGFLLMPLVNRLGHLLLSRIICLLAANLIVLGNCLLLGRESGAEMVFFALLAVPFAIFDLRDVAGIAFGVSLSVLCFVISFSGVLHGLESAGRGYAQPSYYLYSAAVTLVVLLWSLAQSSIANARAERELRLDIEERRRAERELAETRQLSIHATKMATVGEMSANLGHEVKNPLAAILLRAQGLRRLLAKDPPNLAVAAKAARDIEQTVHRIRRIVDALRALAREADEDPLMPERAAQIVHDTVELCAQRFRQHDIVLETLPIPDDLFIRCRSGQISQVLLNLLSNAHDAVSPVATRRVRIGVEAPAGGAEVRVVVADNGPGVPPEIAHRIMEPFFTTKTSGQGTGLGLSVSKAIADAHGGTLAYERRGAETRFVLTLPRASAPAAEGPSPPGGPGGPPLAPVG
jgi:signal transduction histidine kinase